jgi:hypothetical protein
MSDLGKLLLFVGALLMVGGLVLIFLGRAHVQLGRLPGDITYRGKNTTIYFPLASSIVVSILLTLIFYVISLFRR